MALVPKIDPNKIFASNAPTQDKPAAFDNYEKGMDETRKNLGRPTIPQLNYLHQTADMKNLYIHQNGAALPYDASIEYAENAVTVKDGELKQLVDGAWVETKIKSLPATALTTASSQNQQEINDFGGAKWYAKSDGYGIGATVKLENGDIVKSTVPSNIVDPNASMTGWVNHIADQKTINALLKNLQDSTNKKIKIVSGVIRNRNDGNGWQLIEDAAHTNVNILAIGTNDVGVNIQYNFTAKKVISFVATGDEQMSKAGMLCGGSVGTNSAGLWIGAPLQFWVDPISGVVTPPAWFKPSEFSVTGTGATRTINHPEISDANIAPVLSQGFAPTLVSANAQTSTLLKSAFSLQSTTNLASKIYYNGSAWVVSTDIDTASHPISATWESANGGQLRVTHSEVENAFTISCSAASNHRVVTNNTDVSSFTVQFFGTDGTQVATPVVGLGMFFSRPRKLRTSNFKSTRLNVSRGSARLDPTRLHDGTLPLANIWFFGVMEVD